MYSQTKLTLDLLLYILFVVVLAVLFDAKSTKNFGTWKNSLPGLGSGVAKRHTSVGYCAKAHSFGELKLPSSQTLLTRNGAT